MDTSLNITFKVTPAQKEALESRMRENGFDEISVYLKIAALKTRPFAITQAGVSSQEASIELGCTITPSQKTTIEERMKECGCQDIGAYFLYVGLYSVITSVVEVRSSGSLDEMLKRIAQSRNL
jgi:hypothetical protein